MNVFRSTLTTITKTLTRRQAVFQSTAAALPVRPIPVSGASFSSVRFHSRIFSSENNLTHVNKPFSQAIYQNQSSGVHKAFFNLNDPRTFPRYIVSFAAASLFCFATANSYWYKHHHFNPNVKNDDQFFDSHNERPVQMVRTLSNGPIVMNAKRYESLRHYGLGVDKDEMTKRKMERDTVSNN